MTTITSVPSSVDPSVHNPADPSSPNVPCADAQRFAQVPDRDPAGEAALDRRRREPIGEFRMLPYTRPMTWYEKKPWMRSLLDRYLSDAGPGEDRTEARRRIVAALEAGESAELDLSELGLRALPPVLPPVKALDVSNNRLVSLTALPCKLEILDAFRNDLRELPSLPEGLRELHVSDNALTHLPAPLPKGLNLINASRNALVGLPRAPDGLMHLYVVDNRGADLRELARERLREAAYRRPISVSAYLNLSHWRRSFFGPDCQADQLETEFARAWSRVKR
jgi:Leucine-rich repeat (LRR) protein